MKKYIVRFNGVGEILTGEQLITLIQKAVSKDEKIDLVVTTYGEEIPSSVAADVAFRRVFGVL